MLCVHGKAAHKKLDMEKGKKYNTRELDCTVDRSGSLLVHTQSCDSHATDSDNENKLNTKKLTYNCLI